MLQYTKIGLVALAFATAPAFAQDRGPNSPNAPNTAAEQSTARDAAKRNCEQLSGQQKDACMRDFHAHTGSRTEAPKSPQQPGVSGGGRDASSSGMNSDRGSSASGATSSGSTAQRAPSSESPARTQ
jgi:hypothetical protein